jgi:hypothetical protein
VIDLGTNSVEVTWPSANSFQATWDRELKHLGLQVPASGPHRPYLHQPFTVGLAPPGGRPLKIRAKVVAHLPSGFALALELAPLLREKLQNLVDESRSPAPTATPSNTAEPPPVDDPQIHIDAAHACAEVSFRSSLALKQSWESGLGNRGLVLQAPPPHPTLYSRFDVTLKLLDEPPSTIRGTVIGHTAQAFRVRLSLQPIVKSLIESLIANKSDNPAE